MLLTETLHILDKAGRLLNPRYLVLTCWEIGDVVTVSKKQGLPLVTPYVLEL